MEAMELRLECLKVAATKTANQQEILAKAKEYLDFVSGTHEVLKIAPAGNPAKQG